MQATIDVQTKSGTIKTDIRYVNQQGYWNWAGTLPYANGLELPFILRFPFTIVEFDNKAKEALGLNINTHLSAPVITPNLAEGVLYPAIMNVYRSNPVCLSFIGSYGTSNGVWGGENGAMHLSADGNVLCGFLKNGLDWDEAQRRLYDWATEKERDGVTISGGRLYRIEEIKFDTFARFEAALEAVTPKPKEERGSGGFEIEYRGDYEVWNGFVMD